MIGGGNLDRRITFQERTETRDAMNQLVETYSDIQNTPTMWAMKLRETSREFWQAQQMNAEIQGGFLIRYRADFEGVDQTKMRLVVEGINYNIQSISEADFVDGNPAGRKRVMQVLVTAGL